MDNSSAIFPSCKKMSIAEVKYGQVLSASWIFTIIFPLHPTPWPGHLLLYVCWDKFQFLHLRVRRSTARTPDLENIEFYVQKHVQTTRLGFEGWIAPADRVVCFVNTYPLDSDLSIQPLNNWARKTHFLTAF